MKMKPSIALFAASALLAGMAGAQDKAAEASGSRSTQTRERNYCVS